MSEHNNDNNNIGVGMSLFYVIKVRPVQWGVLIYDRHPMMNTTEATYACLQWSHMCLYYRMSNTQYCNNGGIR